MLNDSQIQNVAKLAKLSVDDDLEHIKADLNNFLALIDKLQAVDTNGIKPMAHPFDMTQRLRVDEVQATNQRKKFQKIAPQTDSGHYLVPKVL